jgi:hypothetical protein
MLDSAKICDILKSASKEANKTNHEWQFSQCAATAASGMEE